MMFGKGLVVFSAWILIFLSSSTFAATEVRDWQTLRTRFGLAAYAIPKSPQLKIAVLDNGFQGFTPEKRLLPASAQILPFTYPPSPTSHGLLMAQIIWAMTGKNPDGPQFYLLNTNGFTNLKAAVQFVIDQRIDIVLYSQVWPFGGNFDGHGFINRLVSQAVEAGTVWINAAGNTGLLTYNGVVRHHPLSSEGFLKFGSTIGLPFENLLDENDIQITLSWTDFSDDETYCTRKDLDLFVLNERGQTVASSEWIQKGEAPPSGQPSQLSSHAREAIHLRGLDRGAFFILVKNKSKNFDLNDRFRITIENSKDSVLFYRATQDGEILPPADHPQVITVGDLSPQSSKGPTADGRDKPDLLLESSEITFTNGRTIQSTSNAAAIFAGILATLKLHDPRIDAQWVRNYMNQLKRDTMKDSMKSYRDLVPDTITEVQPQLHPQLHPKIQRLIPQGSLVARSIHDHHYVILTVSDPFLLEGPIQAGLKRSSPQDRVFVDYPTNTWAVLAEKDQKGDILAAPTVLEFRQMNSQTKVPAKLWRTPLPREMGF